MGYTHYWDQHRHLTADESVAIRAAVTQIIAKCGTIICREYDEPNKPAEITAELIAFNGPGDDGHETFWLEPQGMVGFAFCKTAHKPYDVAVTAALAAIERLAPGAFSITSDGDPEDWAAGCKLASSAIGLPCAVPAGVTE